MPCPPLRLANSISTGRVSIGHRDHVLETHWTDADSCIFRSLGLPDDDSVDLNQILRRQVFSSFCSKLTLAGMSGLAVPENH